MTWYACTTQVLRMCYEAETPHALSSKLLYHPNSSNPHVLSSKLLYASVSCSVSVTEVCVCRSVCVLHFARQSEWARRDAAGITPPSTCRRHYTIVSGGSSREAGGGCGCALGGLDCCLIFSVRLPGLKQDRQCKRLEQTASTRHWSRLQVDLLSPSPDITTTCLSRRTGTTNGAVASGPTRQFPRYLVEVAAATTILRP